MILYRKPLNLLVSSILVGAALPVAAGTLSFTEVPVPVVDEDGSDAHKRALVASPAAVVNGDEVSIGFRTLMRSGQGFDIRDDAEDGEDIEHRGHKKSGDDDDDGAVAAVSQLPFGTLVDNRGNPIPAAAETNSGATRSAIDNNPFLSNDNDFSSLIPHGDKLFMVSQFEARPAAMYISGLDQNRETGELTALWTRPIDFSEVRGGWVHCAGSVTPWNTHLGSEEYEPDARLVQSDGTKYESDGVTEDAYYHAMADYFQGDRTKLNPYDYGYAVEVSVENEKGDTDVVKHYAMGRAALELAYVMPDKKTAYFTDDGRLTGLFMFIADRKGDLSAGTLYAARWNQTSPDGTGLGEADLDWINLGHATNDEIESYLTGEDKLTFDDIFSAAVPNTDGTCADGYSLVFKGHDKTAGDSYAECLMLKPGMAKAASRLETRRYAALLGATTEFNKEEGITFDPDMNRLYIAMSDVTDAMLNGDPDEKVGGVLGLNHIRVEENRCGAVYAADINGRGPRAKDTDGRRIRSQYVAVNMYPLVGGASVTYPSDSPYAGNSCDVDSIANPDNLTYLPGYKTLVIGEDTGRHQNDMVWSYNTETGDLTRIETTPYGSETTSVYWYPNINGFGYLMSVVQHPFGESDQAAYISGSSADRGYTGYIGPFPALD